MEWAPNWRGLVIGGKVKADLEAEIRGRRDETSSPDITEDDAWEILGTNPTGARIKAVADAYSRWYLTRMISEESSCRQFDSEGRPLKSRDNGYGLMQLTNPAPNSTQIYDWTANIQGGVKVLYDKEHVGNSPARPFWDDQIRQWTAYNRYWRPINPDNVVDKPEKEVGDEIFAHDPGTGEREILDALIIKAYNGASRGHWAAWTNDGNVDNPDEEEPTNGEWAYNNLNSDERDYVEAVLTSLPCGG